MAAGWEERRIGFVIQADAGRVLMVALRFPPHGGGGVHRIAHFVHNLPAFGWAPHVLTGPGNGRRHVRDRSLLELVEGAPVTRTGYVEVDRFYRMLGRIRLASLSRMLTPWLPTMQAGWIPFAVREGRRLLEDRPFDAIWSSAYPMSSHVVAYLLHRTTGVPWVADYRDEWSIREVVEWPTPAHHRLACWIDRKITGAADRVVTTSPAHTERFIEHFPGGPSKYVTITNGFDPEDFPEGVDAGDRPDEEREGPFTVAHVGTVFGWRGPDPFLEAVRSLLDEGIVGAQELRVRFVGYAPDLGFEDLKRAGVLQVTGYLSHEEAVQEVKDADLLLLINTERTNIPGKTFEYLASGRPILAAVREGPTADLVREKEAGEVVPPDDSAGMERALRRSLESWRQGRRLLGARRSDVSELSRVSLTKRLAEVLGEVSEPAVTFQRRDPHIS